MWAFGAYDGGSNPPGTTSASDSEQSSLDADSEQGAALLRPWFESARDYSRQTIEQPVSLCGLPHSFGLFEVQRLKKTANSHVSGLMDGVKRVRKLSLCVQLDDSTSAAIVSVD